jgi:anti-sigma factor (TIGR02949 family)
MRDAFESLDTSCAEAVELVDAYALGALENQEAAALQQHLSDCAPCREELSKSQRTAALLSLSVRIEEAPSRLRDRILARAESERYDLPAWRRLVPSRRTSTRALAVAGVGALVFAVFLQAQLSNLRGDKDQLQEQLSAASSELEQQRQVLAVLSAQDTQKVSMESAALRSQAESTYSWSQDSAAGFIVCRNFPAQAPGRVYQVWFVTGERAETVATFVPQDGSCQIPMDMSRMTWRPEGIAISVEPQGGSNRPTKPWFSYAWFDEASKSGGTHEMRMGILAAAIGP